MKNAIRIISGIIIFALIAVSIFVPVSVSAANYTAPANAKFITDVTVGRILAGITPGTTVSDLETMFSGYTLSVKNASNATITGNTKISTGCKVSVLSSGSTVDTFITIIYGDVNNDGIIDSTDSVAIIQAITGNTTFDRINFLAADITNDKKNNATDLLNMSLHLLDVNAISQTASSEVKTLGKKVRIVTIGDSITDCIGSVNSYRTKLSMNLYNAGANVEFVGPRESGDSRTTKRYRKHAGYSGFVVGPTTPNANVPDSIYHKLNDIFPYDSSGNVKDIADIGLMMIGHNNYFKNVSLATTNGKHPLEDEYKNLVREIFARQPNLTLYCATMINEANGHSPDYNYQDGGTNNKNFGFTYDQAENANLHNWVEDLVKEGYDVRYFDLCNATNLCAANGDFDPSDGVHPNEVGQAKMADAWFARIVDDVLARNSVESSGTTDKKVTSVKLDRSEITLYEGYDDILTATISPSDADFSTVVWTSNNKSVATVDTFGNIKAVSPGVTIISAASLSGNMSDVCKVTVLKDPESSEMPTNLLQTNFNPADKGLFAEGSDVDLFNNQVYLGGYGCRLISPKFNLGNKWTVSLTQTCPNNFIFSWGETYYTDFTIGKIKVRIADCARIYKIYYDDVEIASVSGSYDRTTCRFTIRYDKGNIKILKENPTTGSKKIMLEAQTPNENYYTTCELYNYEIKRDCKMTAFSINTIR